MPRNLHIYMDYNATAPVLSEARDAMFQVLETPSNASSVHAYGRIAKKQLEDARKTILNAMHAEGEDLIFTSTGTEANHLAILGFDAEELLVSSIEHVSLLEVAHEVDAHIIQVNPNGVINLDALECQLEALEGRPLVSVMLANNETGVIQPIKKIRDLVLQYRGFLHVDAVQAVGKIPVNFHDLGADMMTISGHKIGAGQGAAALIIKRGLEIEPHFVGGGQEQSRRAGTENIAAITAFATAIDIAQRSDFSYMEELRNAFEQAIESISPEAIIVGHHSDRLPNTSYVIMPNVESQTQLMHFDLAGIAVSSGSACSSGKVGSSHVLEAMGMPQNIATCGLRFSFGPPTTKADIEKAVETWQSLYERTHSKAA